MKPPSTENLFPNCMRFRCSESELAFSVLLPGPNAIDAAIVPPTAIPSRQYWSDRSFDVPGDLGG